MSALHVVSVLPLVWASGLEFALDAVAQANLRGTNLRYTIVGAGDYADAITYGARLWGMWHSGQVQCWQPERAAEALNQADLLLHAPYQASFAPLLLTALERGIPIVASDAPPLPQLLGAAALIVPRRRPDALRDALVHLAAQPAERHALAVAAQAQAPLVAHVNAQAWQALLERPTV